MKRSVIIFSLYTFTACIFAQNGYILSGRIENAASASKVYLYYSKDNEYTIDSCCITNGLFSFSGFVEYPVLATIELKEENLSSSNNLGDIFSFYLENSPIEIEMNRINTTAVISGSRTHDLHMEFLKLLEPLKEEMNNIKVIYRNATPLQLESQIFNDSLMMREQNVHKMNSYHIYRFVKKYPNDFISLYLLKSQLDNVPDDEQILVAFSSLSSVIRESTLGVKIGDKLRKIAATSIGSTAPEFECIDIDGNQIKLSNFRGKYLFLIFWASDCSYCLEELPYIERVYNLLGGKDFTVLAVAQDPMNRKNDWENFVRNNKLPWTNLFDERINGKKKIAGLYNIHKTPSNFLLDKNGKIVAKNLYGEKLFEKLSDL